MGDPVADLRAARAELSAVEARIDEHGEDAVRRVAKAHDAVLRLLDSYLGSATGTGDFEAYVRFQEEFVELVEGLPEDLPEREAFEAANETVDQRRLSEDDFERARSQLAPAAEVAGLLDEREDARERVREARRQLTDRLDELDERVEDLERLLELGEADLDAPTEELREPVEAYNEAVTDAFEEFRREESARDLLAFVAETAAFPLVDYEEPPAELRTYVENHEAGTEPVPTLLTYADYSESKRAHYVDDPDALRTNVAVHRTYLERLDAEPLTVSWPPPPTGRLSYRARELVSAVARFADEPVVARARELRTLTDDPERYERLRTAAAAEAELTEDERERLAAGDVEAELAEAREERERLRDALDDDGA